ncbi:MAG: flavin reductase family protein [Clostridium sp.]|jgi:flavin reductase (DIM6/NTAB) family NADH-FMN oxidoreductase RutF|nr:flavin reductase family protein [Clostridium sp.]
MLSIDPNINTERDNYKLLIGGIIPRPIAFVTSLAEDGTVNGAPFSYYNVVSSDPPLISLAIQRKNGGMKDTARNILKEKAFVVHGVDTQNLNDINETAANLLPDESEIKITNLSLVDSDKIKVPGIKESKIRMECILETSLSLGDNGEISADLIIGRVVKFHIDEDIYNKGRIDPIGLDAISRLTGSNYAKIGEIISIERPK